mmetsp:Transcript_91012/g.161199  ORF Transcript_91012/g.161199 Transcript_91012/m.161199 type:complete len:623 (+) Transcript_91012:85-1953(+)
MSPLDPELLPSQAGMFGDASSGSSTVMQSNPFSGGCGFADPFGDSGVKGSSSDTAAPTYLGSREEGVFVFGASLASPQEPVMPSNCEVGGTRRRAAASRMRRCREQRPAQGWSFLSQTSPMPPTDVAGSVEQDDATVGDFEAPSASEPGGSTESVEADATANVFDVPCSVQQNAHEAAGIPPGAAPTASQEPAPNIFRFGVQHGSSSSAQQEPPPSIFRLGVPLGASSSTEYCSGSGGAGTTTEPPIFRFGMQPQQPQEPQEQMQTEHVHWASEAAPRGPASSTPEACATAPDMASPEHGPVFFFGWKSTVHPPPPAESQQHAPSWSNMSPWNSGHDVLHVPWGGTTPDEAAQAPSPLPAATFLPTERRGGGADRRRQVGQRRHAHEDLGSTDAAAFACSDASDNEGPTASTTTPAAPSLSWRDCMTLEEARTNAKQQNYVEALQACLSVLSGPQEAVTLLTQICRSWEKVGQDRVREHEEEMRSRMSQLMAARDRSETLRRLKEKMEVEFQNERHRREESQEQYVWLRRQYDEVLKENKKLRQQTAREAYRTRQAPQREEVVRQMAEFECGPLRQCSSESRVAIKKKLLLKWHPDKQPSMENAALATAVMQELQNRPEWDE